MCYLCECLHMHMTCTLMHLGSTQWQNPGYRYHSFKLEGSSMVLSEMVSYYVLNWLQIWNQYDQ